MSKKSYEWLKPFKREFVENDFKLSSPEELEQWFRKLLDREIDSPGELEKWVKDYSELAAVIGEDSNQRYVAMTCNTKDEKLKDSYLQFVRELQPKITEMSNLLDKKYFSSPHKDKLDKGLYERLDRLVSTSIELFSESNIPLEVKLSEMSQQYQTITGGWTVEFDGKKQTMPQMGRYQLNTDRSVREKAWKAVADRRIADVEPLEKLFDEMLVARQSYASNLGLKDYREYAFKSKLRDYTPKDCTEFHDAIEKAVMPLLKKIRDKRKSDMKLDSFRPWDMAVDQLGRAPLEPFKKVEELQDGVEDIFKSIDPRLGQRFNSIREFMDLDSRDGKAPGGYQTTFEERRVPFIFTNAAGLHNDVITLLHEGGHAFHTLQCRTQPFIWYRHATMEFAEVASMTQELFANPFLETFYGNDGTANRARLEQLERVVDIFPWVATIDAFQHWLYTNPGHSGEERAKAWLEISARFETDIDRSGLNPDIRKHAWHRQLHLFEVPFYYIEYAIAQLGALQFYKAYKDDHGKAVDNYLNALSLGGSKGPKELFEAGEIKFDFSCDTLKSLMDMVEEEMKTIE